ncbi:CehA/McbA family metallohydrolase [Thalassoglobus sp. JC818]|uniref:CehA/McbA family metallohydrolase n=1 Tax=Thalassoglobus sp. JC818 TaxID=3232136 RepID=UPI00345A64D5
MRFIILGIVTLSLYVVGMAFSYEAEIDRVEVAILSEKNWDQFVPEGKEVDAIYGDIVLRNQHLVAVIAKPVPTRNANMTVRSVGGCLIDLTCSLAESDQLSCFYPGGNGTLYSDWEFGVDGQPEKSISAELETKANSATVTVIAQGTDSRPEIRTTYELGVDDKALTIRTQYSNAGKKTLTILPSDTIRADGGSERMTKSPNGTTSQYFIDDQYWGQAYVFSPETAEIRIQCNSDSRNSTLKYLATNGNDLKQIGPDAREVIVRRIAAGRTLSDAVANLQTGETNTFQETTFAVTDGSGKPVVDALIEFSNVGIHSGSLRTNERGEASSQVAIGVGEARISQFGTSLGVQEFTVAASSSDSAHRVILKVPEYQPGKLELKVADSEQTMIPCKVEIIGVDGTPSPEFGPDSADFAVRNLRYTPNGICEQTLPSGRYLIRVSHGPEFSSEEFETEIKRSSVSEHEVTLHRSVSTPGWISSDFHSHSSPSGDNTASQRGRVLNLVCEHIEFAPCTEHNRITTYEPHFEALGIKQFISSVTGMELTGQPLPLNHQNVFPLHHHPHHQDGGGPTTDTDVERQVQRLAAWDNGSEKLIQQNHPDVGWLVYDKDGDGTHDHGHSHAISLIDVMEIHPIDRALLLCKTEDVSAEEAKSNRIFKWLQLLNQGKRIPGVVNTDAHYNFHGSGWLRNWIECSTDDPSQIDPMEIVRASEEGRVVMSNGPFLSFTATADEKTTGVGQDLAAPSGEVQLKIDVQCPNWHEVDTVFVLVNGRAREDLIFTREEHPAAFESRGEGGELTQNVSLNILLKLDSDAHLVAVAGGINTQLGPVVGPRMAGVQPTALTNPIFVDVDGDGVEHNLDTLGRPLPVKGD